MFTTASVPLYFAVPTLVDSVVHTGSVMPLYGFCASTVVAVSMMGGVYAILPAYEADLFGAKYVGAIHGKMMLYSAGAALSGDPTTLTTLNKVACLLAHYVPSAHRPLLVAEPAVYLREECHHGHAYQDHP